MPRLFATILCLALSNTAFAAPSALEILRDRNQVENVLHFASETVFNDGEGCVLNAEVWDTTLVCSCSKGDNAFCACVLDHEFVYHATEINACEFTSADDDDAEDGIE